MPFESWGESAGSISIALHMVAYDGDLTMPHTPTSNTSLFRGAFMESGAQLPTGSQVNGQECESAVSISLETLADALIFGLVL